ncbi:uncharacterized protein LOC133457676 [Cololabis saira]|uniref:uncharacterized protein LOC133457676 n=1 Tax=Cololabis saira TaxID=129043 RepID=UPI002AD4AD36|nr:uncharacterized protein LOC133457676 [Cololabis saira]
MSYITAIDVSLNEGQEEMLRGNGYIQNPVNLEKRSSANPIYLWYKRGSSPGITRVQLSLYDAMTKGLKQAGYQMIDKDLNSRSGGTAIYLWYCCDSTGFDAPIVDFFLSTEPQEEAQLFRLGWERLACNLNRKSSGSRIYLWVKRERPMYLCDIKATKGFDADAELFNNSYIRIDENTNRGAGGPQVFIWYRQKADSSKAITDLQVSTNHSEYQRFEHSGYSLVDQDLNVGTGGDQINLWYKRDGHQAPIKTATLIIGRTYLLPYQRAGVKVIDKSLNTGNDGPKHYLSFYQ